MKRNSGIDLLRLVLMLMVVVLHVLGQGGILAAVEHNPIKYGVAWLLETSAYCAVNCYAMITGYVYVGKKCKLSSVGMIWLQTWVYSLGIAACAWVLKPDLFSWKVLSYFAFPVTNKAYWYVSAYIGLFILIPLLNAGIEQMTEAQMKKMLMIAFVTTSVFPTLMKADPYITNEGYSTIWLCLMYLIGASIKKYGWGQKVSGKRDIIIYVGCVVISWGWKLIKEALTGNMGQNIHLILYTSPTIVMAAVALLLAFIQLEIPEKKENLIKRFAPAAFGVYLIHVHEYVFGHYFRESFAFLAEKNVIVLVVGVLGLATLVFLGCLMVDYMRHLVFEWLKIKKLLIKFEEKLMKKTAFDENIHLGSM